MKNGVRLQAHKGVECEYPENTMPSFRAAAEQGYEMIELDVRATKDDRFVLLHDVELNSRARLPDGSELPEQVRVTDVTYEEALRYDLGISFSERFRGTHIPLFDDVLKLAAENDILLKIDNKLKNLSPYQLDLLFELIRRSGARVCISCWNREIAEKTIKELPTAEISFDGLSDEKELAFYCSLAGKDRFSVWLPVDFERASWAPEEWFATPEKAELIKKYAKLCIWAIKDEESFNKAAALYKPYAAETNGNIKPER